MTLVELLGGLALLGSVMAGILIAHGRFARQYYKAEQRQEAVAAVDTLLTRWFQTPPPEPPPPEAPEARPESASKRVPRRGSGPLPGTDDLYWRTRVVRSPQRTAQRLGAQRIALTVRPEEQWQRRSQAPPVLRIELLVSLPQAEDTDTQPAGASTPGDTSAEEQPENDDSAKEGGQR